MQLIIDIGNTRVKLALFEKNELKHSFVFKSTDDILASTLFHDYAIANCILVTVVNNTETFVQQLQNFFPVLIYTTATPTPLINKYASPQTLGGDRLAAAVGANNLFPNSNLLIIDTGTCIKYNFVSDKNEFLGGSISPGLKMRFKAINTFTARLPLLELDDNFDTLIATDTKGNILSGVALGAVAEIEGIINQYIDLHPNLTVILTGGDSLYFEKRLKRTIFADAFITLKGLNVILNFNTQTPHQ
jgi:type III pantothenate kinase